MRKPTCPKCESIQLLHLYTITYKNTLEYDGDTLKHGLVERHVGNDFIFCRSCGFEEQISLRGFQEKYPENYWKTHTKSKRRC